MTGFADEAGAALTEQIEAHRALGWDTIEMRLVGKDNFTTLDDASYARVRDQLAGAGMGVSCFGSPIANWARPISGDFAVDLADLRRAAPRMRELGVGLIRIMSWPNDPKQPLSRSAWRGEAVRRLRALADIAAGEGITLVHENCSGYGGEGPEEMLDLFAAVNSPALRMAFDTGNQTAHHGYADPDLSWKYYRAVRGHIVHLHIKDNAPGPDGKAVHCMPGEGRGQVRRIVADLVEGGYRGFVSIEPHIQTQVHLSGKAGGQGAFEMYVEYGRRAAAIVAEAGGAADAKSP
jgi:sugar phosphate isomerase/epimerase